MIPYIISTIIGLGISYLLFLIFLKKEKSFQFKRFFLLGSLVLCLLAPLLEFDMGTRFSTMPEIEMQEIPSGFIHKEIPEKQNVQTIELVEKQVNWFPKALFWGYILVSSLFLVRFFLNLFRVFRRIQSNQSFQTKALRTIILDGKHNPHSFFNYLFINKDSFENKDLSDAVIAHELAHSKQFHSADVVFVEFLLCFFWCNPFLWLYKKAMVENHEFLADEKAVNSGIDVDSYSLQLINSENKNLNFPLMSGFNFSLTKNRILMLHKKSSSKTILALKTGMAISLFAVVFTLISFTPNTEGKTFTVVIDAGHGGKDPGTYSIEKDINLQIAKKLKALSQNGNVKIILTRENDKFKSLDERVIFIKEQNADMLLSLHCNASNDKTQSGVEVYYPRKGKLKEKSHQFSKIIIANYLEEIAKKGEIKTAGFTLLRELEIPRMLLELGFLSNEADAKTLQNPETQQKIAESIYGSLLEISKLQ